MEKATLYSQIEKATLYADKKNARGKNWHICKFFRECLRCYLLDKKITDQIHVYYSGFYFLRFLSFFFSLAADQFINVSEIPSRIPSWKTGGVSVLILFLLCTMFLQYMGGHVSPYLLICSPAMFVFLQSPTTPVLHKMIG